LHLPNKNMRIAVDTGGTFTDLVIEDDSGRIETFKTSTTPDDPTTGIFNALNDAASARAESVATLLQSTSTFIHATTRAINAVLTGNTAKTAFLCTAGHRDTLLFREGGRIEIFNFSVEYPDPYIPRALSFEVPERIAHDGSVVLALDEPALMEIITTLREQQVEAVGVCLLWSIVNSQHERRIGELLAEHLPGVAYTLSHQLNPTLREYRRASSTCIDASLKPLMSDYLHRIESRLRIAGFQGRFLMVTSQGGVKDGLFVADAPIHAINSGPAMAPVGGRHFAKVDLASDTVIVADTGGTSFDVSLVRDGRIPWTRETWLGEPYRGHMTGFPSIDVKSIGAGGGSIAWVDGGGMLHVGPHSASADPGPACYARGGLCATVTDAALVCGILDPDYFLGGRMALDLDASAAAIERDVGLPLGLTIEQAAIAIIDVVSENMVQAIENLTIHQGVDPRSAVLVAGGGAAGFNIVAIARRLGCREIIVPQVGALLSAAGSLMANLGDDYTATLPTTATAFDRAGVNAVLDDLAAQCEQFIRGPGQNSATQQTTFFAEARYSHQVWDIEVPLANPRFVTDSDVERLVDDFHRAHEAMFAVRDPDSDVEIIHWHARVRCQLQTAEFGEVVVSSAATKNSARTDARRRVAIAGFGVVEAQVLDFSNLKTDQVYSGPAVVESQFTSVVIEPGVEFERSAAGSLLIKLVARADADAAPLTARRW
jgi:N-methylhydantoinase A